MAEALVLNNVSDKDFLYIKCQPSGGCCRGENGFACIAFEHMDGEQLCMM